MAYLNGARIVLGLDYTEIKYDEVDDSFSLISPKPIQNKVISQAIMIEDETTGKFYVPMLKIVNRKPQLHLEEFTEVV